MNDVLLQTLLPAKYDNLLNDYLSFLQSGYAHFSRQYVPKKIKLGKLKLLEKALRTQRCGANPYLKRLLTDFAKENLSLYLLLDLLIPWRYLASDKYVDSERQISEIIAQIASPAARLVMVLNNENASTYLPAASLVAAVLFWFLLSDNSALLKRAKMNKAQKVSKLRGLLKTAEVLLTIVGSRRLKFKLALLLNRLKILLDRYAKNKQQRISRLDECRIFLYSAYQFLFIKRRTTAIKGI